MKSYYIEVMSWGERTPNIIDECALEQAELGLNYLDPDDFMFLCDAESLSDATEKYWDDFSRACFDDLAESMHP